MKPPSDTTADQHFLEADEPVPIPPIPPGPPKGGFKEVWLLAYPVVITMASMSLMGLTDTFFMGYVGTAQQGAAGLGAVLSWTLMSFFNGTITASNTFVAQFYGAEKHKDCGSVVWQAFYVALVATAVVVAFMLPNIDAIVGAIGAKPRITHYATQYMHIRMAGAVFMFANFCVVGFLRGIGDTKTPMKVTLVANALNVLFTYLLVFGKWGLPALGIRGAALGTVISQGIGSGIYLHLLFREKIHATYLTRKFYPVMWDLMKRFLKVGLPIGLWWILEMGGFTVFTMFVSTLGEVELAGHQIVRQMVHLSFLPGVALSVAALTLVGQYLGAGDPESAEKSAKTAIKIGFLIMTSMGLLFILFRTQIATLFNRDPAVIEVASNLFFFVAVFQTLDALGTVSSGAIRGAGDTRWPMLVSLGLSWLFFVPAVFILGKVLGYGLYGAWTGATVYICILGTTLFLRFRGGKWKKMKI
jgi:MATE family multidrug resistance protein